MSGQFARQWMSNFMMDFESAKEQLGELDRQAGDGDFAVNLSQALQRARLGLDELGGDAPGADQVFAAVSTAFLHTGGTSGPLLGMWFREVAKAWSAESDPLAALCVGIRCGTATVQRLGGAQVGDKTMVDAMVPASQALDAARLAGADLTTALQEAALAADRGVRDTVGQRASLGRASYVGELAMGVADPGASAIALFFHAGCRASRGPA